MLGGLGDLAGLLKQAKQMKSQMEQMQAELEKKTFEADAGAGLVVATVNGKSDLTDIRIDPKATEDVEMLEDLVKAAVAAAAAKARDAVKDEMAKLTGGLNLPGLGGLLGGM
ncbi:MAG: YbaB/EbfC family nucleoid-associated protein [Phycisphaerae bacterium]|nr:YbaB/EbfC family nucleoid-associated protein [Phycisphaerae bacterium]